LRQHWVVDILAGFVVTFLAYSAGPRLEEWWERRAAAYAPRPDRAEPALTMESAPGIPAEAMKS
jgi:hypothetical protein